MANEEHVEILRQGAKVWNQWRWDNHDVEVDLRRAILSNANLSRANLSKIDLSGANLSGANLFGAYLGEANLSGADLSGANLREALINGANLSGANIDNVKGVDQAKLIARGAVLEDSFYKAKGIKGIRSYTARLAAQFSRAEKQEVQRLSLMFEVDEGVSPDAAVAQIYNVISALSNYHIACGGQGLSIDDCQAFSFKGALVPGGAQ